MLTPSPHIDWAYLLPAESKDRPFPGQRGTSFPLSLSVIRNQNILQMDVINISGYDTCPAQKVSRRQRGERR